MTMQQQRSTSEVAPAPARAALAGRVLTRIALLGIAAGAVLFATAGTLDVWEMKLWLACTFIPLFVFAAIFLVQDPGILRYRLDPNRRTRSERRLWAWFAPVFALVFVVPGLDFRFRWSDVDVETVPVWLALLADSLVVLAILFGGYVLKITGMLHKASPGDAPRALLSTGPYHLIRHPLHAASLLVWLATPVALGSWVGLPVFLLVTPYYILRLRSQEKILMRELPGYAAYCRRTPFRLIPFVW